MATSAGTSRVAEGSGGRSDLAIGRLVEFMATRGKAEEQSRTGRGG